MPPRPPLRQFLWDLFDDGVRAATVVIVHTIVLFVLIGSAFLVERFIQLLWNGREPAILKVSISQIVLGFDIFLLIAFLGIALFRAVRAFWR